MEDVSAFDVRRTVGFIRPCWIRSCASAEAHAIVVRTQETVHSVWRCAYAVELARVGVRISVADTADVCDGVEAMLQTLRHRRLRAVRDETRGPVQPTETAESLPRDKRGRFHRPHPTGTVPADVHAKFCTSVEKAVQTSKVTHESLVAQKGCCLRGSRPVSGICLTEIKSLDTSCETRTRNLQIRSLARCPLRQ